MAKSNTLTGNSHLLTPKITRIQQKTNKNSSEEWENERLNYMNSIQLENRESLATLRLF